MLRAIKVRIYPNKAQPEKLSQVMGCCRWWYNYALNLCIGTYKATGKAVSQITLNKYLPKLKKEEDTAWLGAINSLKHKF